MKTGMIYSGLLGFVDKIYLITLVCCSISFVKYSRGEIEWTNDIYFVIAGVIMVSTYSTAVILIFCVGRKKMWHSKRFIRKYGYAFDGLDVRGKGVVVLMQPISELMR